MSAARATGEAVPHEAPHPDVISEQRKRGHDSIEDVPPAPQSAEKKPRKTKKAPAKTPAKQSKRKAAKVKVADEGKKALEELEDAVNWTNNETRILLDALLGPDSELYKELGANSRYAYRKVSEQKFSGKRSPESVRSRYERLRKLFTYILAFESMTGNGEGDPDVEELDEQIKNARAAGKDVGNLSGIMLKRWYTEGWYELFNNRLGEHPGLVRQHDFHSGTISDIVEIRSDEGAGGDGFESTDAEEKPARKKGNRVSKRQETPSSSKGVPAPRHKRKSSHTNMGSELADYLVSNAEYTSVNW
ncbi:uncharacterized protein HD556DRAFT_1444519 [Suillus plorans]|uniref:Myb-like domain-containing protein n=1 Tax=Suillus plorans TaxID=116603 RepID=A0A9P7DH68_9AGAM|nr:uncharacterized protein HD556DRAFT_1444519 [Suillus plorans]KAG1792522.1 hypothetical protein HD556DRAFT_1444519 [Suillus plorans]